MTSHMTTSRLLVSSFLALTLAALTALILVGRPAHGAPDGSAPRIMLRAHVVVDGAVIHLDDVFNGINIDDSRVIARSPQPGRSTTLDARWLWRVARRHGLDWRPLSRHDTVTVERASTVITADAITAALRQTLETRISGNQDFELQLDNPSLTVHLPADIDARLTVRRLDYDPRSGRVNAVLTSGRDSSSNRIVVAGEVVRMTEMPVPTRRLGAGQVIRERDLQWITLRADSLDRNVLADEHLIVGQAARRPLSEGRPIRAGDVEPPLLVRRKSMVTIVLTTPTMTLTAQGRALEDGAMGDVVRVENVQSKRTIEATVDGPNAVRVTGAHRIALR